MATRRKKKGSGFFAKIGVFFLMVSILLATAYFTKPSDEKCKLQAAAIARGAVKGDVDNDNAVINNVLDKIVSKAIRVEDKVFYKSIAYVFSGKSKTIGWGAFGVVHVDAKN